MYIQTGDMGGLINTDSVNKKLNSEKKVTNKNIKSEHNKWKEYQESKKPRDYDKMSYWQIISNCSYL